MLSRAISAEMGLSEQQLKGIRVAGLLHDIGKISIPLEILSRPGKINRHEFGIIKNHCLAGYKILEQIEFPWPVGRAILQHHERLDGSGYPYGIAGEDIILEARILGVADVVEAICSPRPYRPVPGLGRALQEISRASGTIYDSRVVDACLKLLANNTYTFERLMAAAEAQECSATVPD